MLRNHLLHLNLFLKYACLCFKLLHVQLTTRTYKILAGCNCMYNSLCMRSLLCVTVCTTFYVWNLICFVLYVHLQHMRSLLHPVLSWGSVLLSGLTISEAVWAGAPCSPSCSHTGRQNRSIKNKMVIAVNCIHYFKAPLDWRYNIHGHVSYNSFLNSLKQVFKETMLSPTIIESQESKTLTK